MLAIYASAHSSRQRLKKVGAGALLSLRSVILSDQRQDSSQRLPDFPTGWLGSQSIPSDWMWSMWSQHLKASLQKALTFIYNIIMQSKSTFHFQQIDWKMLWNLLIFSPQIKKHFCGQANKHTYCVLGLLDTQCVRGLVSSCDLTRNFHRITYYVDFAKYVWNETCWSENCGFYLKLVRANKFTAAEFSTVLHHWSDK